MEKRNFSIRIGEDIQALKEQYENNMKNNLEAYKKLIGPKSYEPHYISSEDIEKMTGERGTMNCEDSRSK